MYQRTEGIIVSGGSASQVTLAVADGSEHDMPEIR